MQPQGLSLGGHTDPSGSRFSQGTVGWVDNGMALRGFVGRIK